MTKVRSRIIRLSDNFHMWIHLLIGITVGMGYWCYFGGSFSNFLFFGILGNLIPDLDHVLYIFIYGQNSKHSKEARACLNGWHIKAFASYCKNNHKNLTGLYSHNLLSVFAVWMLSYYSLSFGREYTGVLFISWGFHYVYDILEDLMFFNKLNPNWLLKFHQKRN